MYEEFMCILHSIHVGEWGTDFYNYETIKTVDDKLFRLPMILAGETLILPVLISFFS
mgnify:CR=1 FL=1